MREAAKDRISSLPDLLLHHILSFLGTKDGARTSILSHRWNWIWTTVPVLDFQITKTSPDSSEKFMDFVGGTMHRHKLSNVYKFFLGSVHHLNESRVHSWISNVVSGNLKEIGLYLRQKQPLFIPLSLFTCESLIFLKLGGYPTNSIRLPKYISFPSLKRLELTGFEISNECWNEELFSNSTVLEELILERCIYRMRNFSISIPTLKLLRIDAWTAEQNDLRDCVLKINAPRLVTFYYLGYLSKDFVLSSFPELMEAAVGFNTGETDGAEVISRLVCALAHVKCLTVCHKTIQAICSTSHLSNNWVTFHNVKMLKISDSLTTDKRLLALLKAVPNLESLVFFKFLNDEVKEDCGEEDDNDSDNEDEGDGNDDADSVEGKNIHDSEDEGDVSDSAECRSNYVYEDNYDNEDNSWALDIVTIGSLFPHLKSVCFQQFYARPRETKWVRLILSDAKALQMVTIRYYGSKLHFANKIMGKIPSYPRASAGCLFNFKFCS